MKSLARDLKTEYRLLICHFGNAFRRSDFNIFYSSHHICENSQDFQNKHFGFISGL